MGANYSEFRVLCLRQARLPVQFRLTRFNSVDILGSLVGKRWGGPGGLDGPGGISVPSEKLSAPRG